MARPALRFFLLLLGILPVSAHAQADDPLLPLIQGMSAFLHSGEGPDGVARDSRQLQNPPEEIRLSVIPQLLGYCYYYRTLGGDEVKQDVVDRANFLLNHLADASSNTPFDGMLVLALQEAYGITGDARYRDAAQPYLASFRALTGTDLRLNWGLMAAMALAQDYRITGNPTSLAKVREILQVVAGEEQTNGSFPHYCYRTRDIHYSAWIGMELVLIHERLQDPYIDRMLSWIVRFLRGRIDALGETTYGTDYSIASGCTKDYDTRGWMNELGYSALVFDAFQDSRYGGVIGRLNQLQQGGSFSDKWGFLPDPSDPIYPWATEQRSVIRTSVIFWSLTSLYATRLRHVPIAYVEDSFRHARRIPGASGDGGGGDAGLTASWLPEDEDPQLQSLLAHEAPAVLRPSLRPPAPPVPAAQGLTLGPVTPNPTSGSCDIQLRAPAHSRVRIEVFDLLGRRVRLLMDGIAVPGVRSIRWDGRDESGKPAATGLYLVRARAGERQSNVRIILGR